MNDAHEPTAEFLAHMERETLYALRRPAQRTPAPLLRHLRTAAMVVLALGVGAGCVVVAERVQDSRRVERELARNGLQVNVAERRVAALKSRVEAARQHFAEGLASVSDVSDAERRLLAAERTLRHVRLEREELDAGGKALARTTQSSGEVELELDLTEPKLGQRDFVGEHLRIDRESSAAELEYARGELERANVLFNSGVASGSVLRHARAAMETLERRLASLDSRVVTRAEFLAGKSSREQCELSDLQRAADLRQADAAALVRNLREELVQAEQLHSAGAAPAPDELRLALDEARSELALVSLELEALGVPSTERADFDPEELMGLGYVGGDDSDK